MKLAFDNHYPPPIAVKLRELGHDAVTALERGWEAKPDEALFRLCEHERRVLLTNDVVDFTRLAREWAAEGRPHAGLLFTSDSSMPRTKRMIGRYVRILDELFRANPETDALADRIHWL